MTTRVPTVTPRTANQADVAELVRVINRAYHVEAEMFHGQRTSETDVRERLARPNAAFLAIDDDAPDAPRGALVGGVYVEIRDRRGYFGMLAVDPSRQGRGLGRVLVRAVETYCASAGCNDVDLDVVDLRSELLDFYAALGFTRTGEPIPYPNPTETKQPVHLIQMTKRLG
jgi:GNAT superfamily N-acetyltransferase